MQQTDTLLDICLKNIYFLFHGKYYEQFQGAAMGSPISLFIANLCMEEFEVKALSSAPHPCSIVEAKHSQQLLQHISSQDLNIQFTMEEPNQ